MKSPTKESYTQEVVRSHLQRGETCIHPKAGLYKKVSLLVAIGTYYWSPEMSSMVGPLRKTSTLTYRLYDTGKMTLHVS